MMIQIVKQIDQIFQTLIFLPVFFLLLYHFRVFKKERPRIRSIHKLCVVLILIFLVRCFLAQFIFTPVNDTRFPDEGDLPLIKALVSSESHFLGEITRI